MISEPQPVKELPRDADDLRAFLLMLRQALLMIVCWIEKKYGLRSRES